MSHSKAFLAEMKELLLTEKKRLELELEKIGKRSSTDKSDFKTQWEDYGDKEEENAAEVAAYSDTLGLEATFESELREVVGALSRMDEGSYGVCRTCGEEIGEQRIRVRPMATLCMACLEKAGH